MNAVRRISIVGGGPGGLFTARLLALRHPEWRIDVYERLPPEGTFGFGVGLSGAVLASIGAVDAETREAIDDKAIWFSTAEFRLPHGAQAIPSFHRGVAIARADLLTILSDQARRAGVDVHVGFDANLDRISASSEIVIAADGVGSAIRQRHLTHFGAEVVEGRGTYLWCGSDAELPGTIFMPVKTPAGVFTAHAYPYGAGRSTYVIETDEATLARAGLNGFESACSDPGASDQRSLTALSEWFQPLLSGNKFVGNRSRWFHFRTVRCRRWVTGNTVLLGDAAATADPSLGSGTKLAMESAIALADALDQDLPVEECLARYEQTRRPGVERLQGWAMRSQLWWDSFPRRLSLSPARIALAYLTRAGAVSLEEAMQTGAALVRTAVAEWAGCSSADVPTADLSEWIVARPLASNGLHLPSRLCDHRLDGARGPARAPLLVQTGDAWGADADVLLGQARRRVGEGDQVVVLDGPASRHALLDRCAVAERVRLELQVPVAVTASHNDVTDVAAALVSGRIDLACAASV
ncbi:FAD-dependent monooxygenase [Amycolatopsis thermoflava]|uniref:FAD-dependent monooxygenase n=1 Tax=Amycolatopsis thermoflava TaxID=84480 RepID=UPI003D72DB7F